MSGRKCWALLTGAVWVASIGVAQTSASRPEFDVASLSTPPSLGRPVVDRTGLEGVYDFPMRLFNPDDDKGANEPKGDTARQLDNGLGASLKNLGLKLNAERVSVQVMVIDHVERLSAN